MPSFITNHIPSTGIGKFDTTYKPASGVMAVRVKIHFDFVQADNTPSSASPGAAAGHLAGFARVANQANPSAPLVPIADIPAR